MGILVFALAILPSTSSGYINVLKAEITGPRFGNILPRVTDSTRYLFYIYIGLTLITGLSLFLLGMNIFDAIIHTFGIAGTGGFSMYNENISTYNNVYIESVMAFGMFLFGMNFNLFLLSVTGHLKDALRYEELRWYMGIIVGSIILITVNILNIQGSVFNAIHSATFAVTAMISSTGIELVSLSHWPLFSRFILLMLMACGGMAGSTSGGFKVSRIIIVIKALLSEVKSIVYPNRVVTIHFEKSALGDNVVNSTIRYLTVYMVMLIILMGFMTLEFSNLLAAFSAVVATFNNIGITFGSLGEYQSISAISPTSKFILSIAMIAGRLEIYPLLIFLTPSIWRDNH